MPLLLPLLKRSRVPAKNLQPAHDHSRMIAEATEPHMAAAVRAALGGLRASLTPEVIGRGLQRGDLWGSLQPQMAQFQTALGTSKIFLANAHLQAGTLAARNLLVRKADVSIDLSTLPDPTQAALDGYDFGLIQQLTDDVRASIADAVGDGIRQGYPPWKIAQRIRDTVGLTDRQAAAVENYRSMLENGNPDALDRALRDQRSDSTVEASIAGLRQLTQDQTDRLVSGYEDRYIAYRATTIARYETLRASNQGTFDAVQSAIDDGTLDPSRVTKTWLIADDELTCDRCRSIVEFQPDGVPMDQPFQWASSPKTRRGIPETGYIDIAPLHPACRCTNGYSVDGGEEIDDDDGF